MFSEILKILLRCSLLILVQIWILDQVVLAGTWIVFFIYPLAIIKLPIRYSTVSCLLIGFLVGFSVDLFTGTYGLNASAGLLLGYIRPRIIHFITPREDIEQQAVPSNYYPGLRWFILFTFVLFMVHSFWFFNVSQFKLAGFFRIQLRALLSGFFSFFLAMLIEILFTNKKRRM
ncbi:MAG: hypothetical protein ACPF8V_04840 [Luteibaculum sp.]